MDDPDPVVAEEPIDQIAEWAAELVAEAEESLARHAEFEALYPE